MSQDSPSIGETLRNLWSQSKDTREGRESFSRGIGDMVPYSGSIGAVVQELEAGHAVVELNESPSIQNHLQSIHAVALVNLAELTTGLALLPSLPADVRGILRGLSISYEKKARGRILARASCEPPLVEASTEFEVIGIITDEAGDVCARAVANWHLSFNSKSS